MAKIKERCPECNTTLRTVYYRPLGENSMVKISRIFYCPECDKFFSGETIYEEVSV